MLKKLFKIYPPLMSFFLSSAPPKALEKSGAKFALKVFNEAARRVPAYKKFLADHQLNPETIKTIGDFRKLPLTGKKNYLDKYNLKELCLGGTLRDKYLIDRSSGYGGNPSYWPRLPEEDKGYPLYMENAYRQFFQIDKKPTLMIITLSLGTWVGGEKISWATRQIAIGGKNPFTVITPGINLKETLEIVENLGDYYEQIVIVGYPPFVKRIIDEGGKRGIDWKKINVKLGLGGEGYSEEWREYMGQKIGVKENDLLAISGGYGAADLGMSVGREYPISVLLRKLAYKDEKLAKDLFGQWKPLPSLCQYNPTSFYIEETDGELVFTAMPAIPVVRYNIHDRGGVISFEEALQTAASHGYNLLKILTEYGYQKKDIWHLPFFYVWGRTHGSALLYGVVIYAENVKAALDNPLVSSQATGNFQMETVFDKEQNPRLQVKIELASGVEPNEELKKNFINTITKTLEEQSTEYNRLHQEMGNEVLPQVTLYKHQDPEIFDREVIKYRYTRPQ